METKKCTKCGEVKILSMFYNKINGKYGKRAVCIKCAKIDSQKYRTNTKDSIKRYSQEWRGKNKLYTKKYYYDNIKSCRLKQSQYSKSIRDKLSDAYIISVLGVKKTDCSPELIEQKRGCLKLFRSVK